MIRPTLTDFDSQLLTELVSGYSGTPLFKKLGVKEGLVVCTSRPPENFGEALGELPSGAVLCHEFDDADLFVLFATESKVLIEDFRKAMTLIPSNGAIWVAWPKKSSGVSTDLTEDVMRELFLPTGMVDSKVCAIDAVWSGLRFVVRKENRPSWHRSAKR
ncbi:MAG: DUF3052 domain-containing protein [Acidimicrobiia bacterium]